MVVIVQVLPYDLVALTTLSDNPRLQAVRLLKLVKLVRIFRLKALLVSFELDYSIRYDRLTLVGLLVTLVYLSHFVACGFKIVALLEDAPMNWMTEMGVEHAPVAEQYLASFYYATAVISNIGFSGVSALTPAEQVRAHSNSTFRSFHTAFRLLMH